VAECQGDLATPVTTHHPHETSDSYSEADISSSSRRFSAFIVLEPARPHPLTYSLSPDQTLPSSLVPSPVNTPSESDVKKTAESARQNVNHSLGQAAGKARDVKDDVKKQL
jgi:hypothetical protein